MNSDGGIYVHPNDYGDTWLVNKCEICGFIFVDYKRYRLPDEFDNYKNV